MKSNFEPGECRGPAEQQLCVKCALCCNGVIFADVKLQGADRAEELRRLGLLVTEPARRRGNAAGISAAPYFSQPCAALRGCRCALYCARPSYCRDFECALLKAVNAGVVRPSKALRLIRSALARVDKVERLLLLLGNRESNLPLAERFRRTTARLRKIASSRESAELYASLTLAMHDLNLVLSEHFYPGSPTE